MVKRQSYGIALRPVPPEDGGGWSAILACPPHAHSGGRVTWHLNAATVADVLENAALEIEEHEAKLAAYDAQEHAS